MRLPRPEARLLPLLALTALAGCGGSARPAETTAAPGASGAPATSGSSDEGADDGEDPCTSWQSSSEADNEGFAKMILDGAIEMLQPQLQEQGLDEELITAFNDCLRGGLPDLMQWIGQRCGSGAGLTPDDMSGWAREHSSACVTTTAAARNLCNDWRAWSEPDRATFMQEAWRESKAATRAALAGKLDAQQIDSVAACWDERQPIFREWFDGYCADPAARITGRELGRRAADAHLPECIERAKAGGASAPGS